MSVNGLLSPAIHTHILQLPRTIVMRFKSLGPSMFTGIQRITKYVMYSVKVNIYPMCMCALAVSASKLNYF